MSGIKSLRERLDSGETVIGTWSVIPSSTTAEIMGNAGLDFSILDFEHGPLDLDTAQEMSRSLELSGCSPLVRVPRNEESWILRALETGVSGVAVPQITTKQDAADAVEAVRYHPIGNRGFSPYTRSAGYTSENAEKLPQQKNNSTICMLMIEGKKGINNLDGIVVVPGIDVIYIGTYDLSQSLGHPGEPTHPDVVEQLESVVQRIQNQNIAVGCLAESKDEIDQWKELGIQLIPYKADCAIINNAIRDVVSYI
jgi:4-hydroxy-2-oxoheptanedioate aldolase